MRTHSIQKCVVAATVPYLLLAGALIAGEPTGTELTYQGQLKQSGVPVSETCDFEFTLWDDPVATLVASQVGPTLTFDGGQGNSPPIDVVNGLFTVELDLGADAFNGDARWLQIDVCCASPCGRGFAEPAFKFRVEPDLPGFSPNSQATAAVRRVRRT